MRPPHIAIAFNEQNEKIEYRNESGRKGWLVLMDKLRLFKRTHAEINPGQAICVDDFWHPIGWWEGEDQYDGPETATRNSLRMAWFLARELEKEA